MSDRELLEAAARAAGLYPWCWDVRCFALDRLRGGTPLER